MLMSTTNASVEPIHSDFADDPDFAELLEMFYESLQERRGEMVNSFQNGDFEQLKTLAHQLKGAGGGYGFTGLTPLAADLELACKTNNLPAMPEKLQALLAYIDRVTV